MARGPSERETERRIKTTLETIGFLEGIDHPVLPDVLAGVMMVLAPRTAVSEAAALFVARKHGPRQMRPTPSEIEPGGIRCSICNANLGFMLDGQQRICKACGGAT
jgi:hypothetical protein